MEQSRARCPSRVSGLIAEGFDLRDDWTMRLHRSIDAVCFALILLVTSCAAQQDPESILRQLATEACATSAGVKVCRYDYSVDGRRVEAISFQPSRDDGPFPGVLLIPGYQRTAKNLVPLGLQLAAQGFGCAAVSQPGFGGSEGPADYVGPRTIKVLKAGYEKLSAESWVDPKRMGIYGYSRGGMAAAILAIELSDVKAAVLGAGIYDFQRLYDDSTLPGVRANMKAETGMTPAAIRERSSILRMERLHCPVLILHGDADKNVPVSQAILLRKRLTELHKEFEIHIFPGREHSIGPEVGTLTGDFLRRKLFITIMQ